MKYLIVLGDGMADKNIPELDNRTPLDYADTPAMDKYSKLSEIGMVRTVPEGMAPGVIRQIFLYWAIIRENIIRDVLHSKR